MIPDGGTIIELGVAAGRFAEQLITANPSAFYFGIDRWSDHHDDTERQMAGARIGRAAGAADKYGLIIGTFHQAVNGMRDECADLIYIDGYAHTGQERGRTLDDWYPKLKHGGIFAGHDYDPEYHQTIAAVDAFVAKHGLVLNLITEKPNSSWWVRKP